MVCMKNKLLPKEENQESMAGSREDLSDQLSMTTLFIIPSPLCLSSHHKTAEAP